VIRVVNEAEASIVREIFELYASGLGITKVAKQLNDRGVPAPRQNPLGWSPCAIREMLRRPLYHGQIIWNASQKIVREGTKRRRQRSEQELIKVAAPHLTIVPDVLWTAVQTRLARLENRSWPHLRGTPPKYLLTGVVRCAMCGGPLTVAGPGTSRREGRFYVCSYHRKRGSKICKNGTLAPQHVLDQEIRKAIAKTLQPKTITEAVEMVLRHFDHEAEVDRRRELERGLANIVGERRRHGMLQEIHIPFCRSRLLKEGQFGL
jgi:site-specific DNA recombinase